MLEGKIELLDSKIRKCDEHENLRITQFYFIFDVSNLGITCPLDMDFVKIQLVLIAQLVTCVRQWITIIDFKLRAIAIKEVQTW